MTVVSHVGQEQAEFWLEGLNASLEDVMASIESLSTQQAYSYATFEMGNLLELLEPYKTKGLRVMIVYSRSNVVPTWTKRTQDCLPLDVLYLHQKPEEGVNNPQKVYDALTEMADTLSHRVHHSAYVIELAGAQLKRMHSSFALYISHPAQRVPQPSLPPAVDLAASPQQLQSAAAHHQSATGSPLSPADVSTRSGTPATPGSESSSSAGGGGRRNWKGVLVNSYQSLVHKGKGNNNNNNNNNGPQRSQNLQQSQSTESTPSVELDPNRKVLVDLVVPAVDIPLQHSSSEPPSGPSGYTQ